MYSIYLDALQTGAITPLVSSKQQLIIPSNPQANEPSTQAFILALLTAGGGLTGYIRTGSVPSVAAGMTVGALVFPILPKSDIPHAVLF